MNHNVINERMINRVEGFVFQLYRDWEMSGGEIARSVVNKRAPNGPKSFLPRYQPAASAERPKKTMRTMLPYGSPRKRRKGITKK